VKFGSVAVGEAEGAILAHSIRHPGGTIKKGVVLSKRDLDALAEADISEVLVARLEEGDVHEDEAAARLAQAIAGASVRVEKPFTGRSNLYAEVAGVLTVDKGLVDRLNRIDPALTVATLPEFVVVEAGRMVATVKVIPFAAPRAALDQAVAAGGGGTAIAVAPFRKLKVGLVATTLPTLKPSVMDKTRRLLDERLAPAGARVAEERRVAHDAEAVGRALAALKSSGNDLLVVFGASAMVDAHDVVPAGIEAAGGTIDHLGMPVDPGNLLILGKIGGIPLLGAPGCARSPKENGFDWILNRLLAGLEVTPVDVTGLGVGGLLMEIVSRPQPREGGATAPTHAGTPPKTAALILAAGQARRMGGPNKLLAKVGERPLARIAAEAALQSKAVSVTVVTGHRADDVRSALEGLDVAFVHNPEHEQGLSTSLRAGVESLPADVDGVVVLLADMPGIDAATIDRLIDAFEPGDGVLIVVPTCKGKRGNPVVWSSRYFPALAAVQGDTGGRHLIGENPEVVVEVEIGDPVAIDVDTPEALAAVGGTLPNN
jgi:molybdenum cofactor cytidylyltransferase